MCVVYICKGTGVLVLVIYDVILLIRDFGSINRVTTIDMLWMLNPQFFLLTTYLSVRVGF